MRLRFEVYSAGKRLTEFNPVGAYAVSNDSTPASGDVYFRDGYLCLNRADELAAGVCLLWPVGDAGEFLLETTRLKGRDTPYNLNVELARARLMRLFQKEEDWNLLDFPKAEELNRKLRAAHEGFAAVLGILHKPAEAAAKADEVLRHALTLGEELSAFHADLLLARRKNGGAFVKHAVGVALESTAGGGTEAQRELAIGHFDYAIVPAVWREIEPQQGKAKFDQPRAAIDQLINKRVPAVVGPIIDFSPQAAPDWLSLFENDYDALRDLVFDHVTQVVQQLGRGVAVWSAVAGLHVPGAINLTFEQSIDMTRLVVQQIKSLLPQSRALVTIRQPFGEYLARQRPAVPPMLYAEMVAQSGVAFDAFGLELTMGVPTPGSYCRDLFQLSCMLDRFAPFGRPVFVTALNVPSKAHPDASAQGGGKLNPSAAGKWRRPWDPELQKQWAADVFNLLLSKPFVESVAWGGIGDLASATPGGGLVDEKMAPRPVLAMLDDLRNKVKGWAAKRPGGPAV